MRARKQGPIREVKRFFLYEGGDTKCMTKLQRSNAKNEKSEGSKAGDNE
jgi:hypothetical protein